MTAQLIAHTLNSKGFIAQAINAITVKVSLNRPVSTLEVMHALDDEELPFETSDLNRSGNSVLITCPNFE